MSACYRCCEHCADDGIHGVERDDHEVPCNVPGAVDCIGRNLTDAGESRG